MEHLFPIVIFLIGICMLTAAVALPLWFMTRCFRFVALAIKNTINLLLK